MLAYGLGDAGTGLAATQLGFYLFPFFICAAGLPAFIAGSPAHGEQGLGRPE